MSIQTSPDIAHGSLIHSKTSFEPYGDHQRCHHAFFPRRQYQRLSRRRHFSKTRPIPTGLCILPLRRNTQLPPRIPDIRSCRPALSPRLGPWPCGQPINQGEVRTDSQPRHGLITVHAHSRPRHSQRHRNRRHLHKSRRSPSRIRAESNPSPPPPTQRSA